MDLGSVLIRGLSHGFSPADSLIQFSNLSPVEKPLSIRIQRFLLTLGPSKYILNRLYLSTVLRLNKYGGTITHMFIIYIFAFCLDSGSLSSSELAGSTFRQSGTC